MEELSETLCMIISSGSDHYGAQHVALSRERFQLPLESYAITSTTTYMFFSRSNRLNINFTSDRLIAFPSYYQLNSRKSPKNLIVDRPEEYIVRYRPISNELAIGSFQGKYGGFKVGLFRCALLKEI